MDVVAVAMQTAKKPEPDWDVIEHRMRELTMRELRPIKRWFGGSLCGASRKDEVIHNMVCQMRHWWTRLGGIGRTRTIKVLKDLKEVREARIG